MSEALERGPLEELADTWQACWTAAEGASFEDCCTADVHYEDPIAVEPLRGAAALEAHAGRLGEAFPDLRIERTGAALGSEQFACLPWRVLATHRGDLPNLSATGRVLTLHGVHYAELEDGRVRRARGFFDLYAAAIQLGLLPARGSLSETALLLVRGFGLRPRA